MNLKLKGKIAAITGGSGGIGFSIAKAFLREGASVSIMARDAVKGAAAEKNLDGGENSVFIQGDATVQADVEDFVDDTIDRFGRLDILVNNAGGAGDLLPLVDLTDESFDYTMKLCVYSTFWATRRALRTMVEQKFGRIINISSVEGKIGKPVFSSYTAAKHAVNGLTKSTAQEVGEVGITVNAICPGLIITDTVKSGGPATAKAMGLSFEEMVDLFAQESAIKRPNEVEQVAETAVLLASEVGAGITGASWSVDGGTAPY
jgi:NAD(P)-dependent dehydrogenase (short-subunit alcohol dehydrogenase family)